MSSAFALRRATRASRRSRAKNVFQFIARRSTKEHEGHNHEGTKEHEGHEETLAFVPSWFRPWSISQASAGMVQKQVLQARRRNMHVAHADLPLDGGGDDAGNERAAAVCIHVHG